jgi:hypothetical protein
MQEVKWLVQVAAAAVSLLALLQVGRQRGYI